MQVQPFSRKEASNYLKLFVAVAEQEAYDQEALLQKFANETWVQRFSTEKNYLYSLILKTMRSFESERSIQSRISGHIRDVGYLFQKGLYPESLKVLKRVKKIAQELDDFPALLQIQQWERRLLKIQDPKNWTGDLQRLIEEKDQQLESLKAQLWYADLYDRLFLMLRQEQTLRKEKELNFIDSLMETELMQNQDRPQTFQSRHYYFQIWAFYRQLRGESELAAAAYRQLLEHWQGHPERIKEGSSKYKSIVINCLAFSLLAKEFAAIPDLLEVLKKIKALNASDKIRSDQNLYFYALQLALNTGDFVKGKAVIRDFEQWYSKYGEQLSTSRRLSFFHNCCVLFFLSGELSDSLKWVNRILSQTVGNVREDSLHFARMLNLILHYELGNSDLVENQLRNVRRLYKNKGSLYPFEQAFLRGMKKLINHPLAERASILTELDTAIQSQKEAARAWPGLEEISIWQQSCSQKRSIAEVAKDRFKPCENTSLSSGEEGGSK